MQNIEYSVIEKVCKNAAHKAYQRNKHIAKREPELKEFFFQSSYMRLLELVKAGKITTSKHDLAKLKGKAWFAIKDAIRDEIVQMPRNRQDDMQVFLCPVCEKELIYKTQKYINPKFCECGTKIYWTFSPLNNPLHAVMSETDLAKDDETFFSIYHVPSKNNQFEKICQRDMLEKVLKIRPSLLKILLMHFIEEIQLVKMAKTFGKSEWWVNIKCKEAINESKKIAENLK